jgi:mRNA interferase MazF
MVIKRGEIWWAELADPRGSEPGYRRPVLVVQSDAFNRSRISTVIVVAITSNVRLAEAPGNVLLSRRDSKLRRDSVINVSQVLTLDERFLVEKAGSLSDRTVEAVESGLRQVLSL